MRTCGFAYFIFLRHTKKITLTAIVASPSNGLVLLSYLMAAFSANTFRHFKRIYMLLWSKLSTHSSEKRGFWTT